MLWTRDDSSGRQSRDRWETHESFWLETALCNSDFECYAGEPPAHRQPTTLPLGPARRLRSCDCVGRFISRSKRVEAALFEKFDKDSSGLIDYRELQKEIHAADTRFQ